MTSPVFVLTILAAAAQADSVELRTSKTTYAYAEVVRFQFVNTSNANVELGNKWPVISNALGDTIYIFGPYKPSNVTKVAAGQSYPEGWIEWNQTDKYGRQIPPGRYTARWLLYDGPQDTQPIVLRRSFFIAESWNYSGVSLTTDKAVYKAATEDPVTFTIENNSDVKVEWTGHWKVLSGSKILLTAGELFYNLYPGKSLPLQWYKNDRNAVPQYGTYVPPGSYTIVIEGITPEAQQPITLSRVIAITKTGRISGSSLFPLAAGNTWVYQRSGSNAAPSVKAPTQTMKALRKDKTGWFELSNLAFQTRWVRSSTSGVKTKGGVFRNLFSFSDTTAYELKGADTLAGRWVIGSKEDTAVTPAGAFEKCLRIDLDESWSACDATFDSFWFAPGVGLVQYSLIDWKGYSTRYSLSRATLKGSDGKTYTIGK